MCTAPPELTLTLLPMTQLAGPGNPHHLLFATDDFALEGPQRGNQSGRYAMAYGANPSGLTVGFVSGPEPDSSPRRR